MPLKPTILLIFCAILTGACSHRPEKREISRLDLALSQGELTAADSADFALWSEITGFEGTPREYAGRTAPFEALVIGAVTDLDSVETVLGQAFADRPEVKLTAVVSPYNQAVVTHPDGHIFIALNHYLGSNSAAYAGFPEFIKQRKVLSRMPVDVVMAQIAAENEPDFPADATLLNHLLYQGALLNQTLKLLPDGTDESTVLGMTPEDYSWCSKNEARIWNTMIERQLLYSTDPEIISRLTRQAPGSPLISADAPGQAALFSAMKLVQAFERNTKSPALPCSEFFNNNQSLIKSAYAPR